MVKFRNLVGEPFLLQQGFNMTEFFLTKTISVNVSQQVTPLSDAKFLFDSNGSVAAAGAVLKSENLSDVVLQTSGSEAWFSEESDIFRFDEFKKLHSVVLSLPGRNAPFTGDIPKPQDGYFSINLAKETKNFIVPPQPYRFLDCTKRILICFTPRETSIEYTRFNVTADLSFLFDISNVFSGWIFKNPLENMTDSFQSEKDTEPVDDASYEVFLEILELFSDNQCEMCDDDMEAVTRILIDKVTPEKIFSLKGDKRRQIVKKALMNLKDYFLEN